MKKVLVICLTVVFMVSMTLTAFAAPGSFVSSPSGNPAPQKVEFKPADEDCTATLVITPYSEKNELPTALKAMMEKAYNDIKGTDDLTTLNAALAKLAKDLKIKSSDLAVSDLFDIHVTGCDYHDEHVDFDIVLAADSLKNFVGLLHMNKNGDWELVEGAKVIANGEHLAFSVDSFSPFAVVVNTAAKPSQTGDSNMIPVYVAIMAVSALALVVILVKSKKKTA
ncbi:MAG: hypothetical protein IJA44_03845 [Clostridia bacterium]|nr:hypothetical protein [Clostridia bacterium]